MTNGEMIQSIFPNMNFGTLAQDDVIVNRDYSNNDEPQVFIPKSVWNAEYKEPKSEWQKDHEILKAYSDGATEVLDKIRAEIEQLKTKTSYTFVNIDDVLRLIDEYKTESEE